MGAGRTVWLAAAGLVGGLSLACGGTSVSPAAHLNAVCDQAPPFSVRGALPRVAGVVPGGLPSDARPVYIQADGVYRDWEPIPDGELAEALADGYGTLLLVPASDAPAARVLAVLRALPADAKVQIAVETETAPTVPAPPDPAYAEAFTATVLDADPSMKAALAAREIEGLIGLCPPAQTVFEAIAMASPDHRCKLMAQGMEEALPSCPLTNGDKVVTAVQVLFGPAVGQNLLGTIAFELDPEAGVPLALGTGTWGDAASAVAAQHQQIVALPAGVP